MLDLESRFCEFESHHEYSILGGVAEWSKAAVLKTVGGNPVRGFESHPLRQILLYNFKKEEIMKRDYIHEWVDELSLYLPEDQMLGMDHHIDEYWHVTYDPDLRQASVVFECYPYNLPDSFKERAATIATNWFNDFFDDMKSKLINILKEASKRDIVLEKVLIPQWLFRNCKIKYLFGIKLSGGECDCISGESPSFAFKMIEEIR